MNILIIDTTKSSEIKVGIKTDEKEDFEIEKSINKKAQDVLPLIDNLLKKNKLTVKDINKIEVNRGPGSFTGTRVGISIANALRLLLNIPINNKNSFVTPIYE